MATTAAAHPGHDESTVRASVPINDPTNRVAVVLDGGYRYIEANGIPDHAPGQFPNRGNPNRISEQQHRFRVPVEPEVNDQPTDDRGMPFGVAVNGVPFDPFTAEFWSTNGLVRGRPTGWNYDALSGHINLGLDASNAHVQPTGAYHYHGIPTGLVQQLGADDTMILLGWAADGFPIYGPWVHNDPEDSSSELVAATPSYRLRDGQRPDGQDGPGGRYDGTFAEDWVYAPGSGDLDECNGRFGVTPEYPDGTYYYVLTDTYPFVPRMFRGTPDASFERRGPRGGRPPRP